MNDEEANHWEPDMQKVRDIHDALFSVPQGSPPDQRPLIEELRLVVRAYHRASWATRAMIWLLPTLAGLAVAGRTVAQVLGAWDGGK